MAIGTSLTQATTPLAGYYYTCMPYLKSSIALGWTFFSRKQLITTPIYTKAHSRNYFTSIDVFMIKHKQTLTQPIDYNEPRWREHDNKITLHFYSPGNRPGGLRHCFQGSRTHHNATRNSNSGIQPTDCTTHLHHPRRTNTPSIISTPRQTPSVQQICPRPGVCDHQLT